MNFSLAEWQQAKRLGKDPKIIKQHFQGAYAISDNQASFANALKERGYILAKGDRRGFVAIDRHCEVFAVPKWVGLKTKDVNAKLRKPEHLPSVTEVKSEMAKAMQQRLSELQDGQDQKIKKRIKTIQIMHDTLTKQHQKLRKQMQSKHEREWQQSTIVRQARFRKGWRSLWDRATGRTRHIKKHNEREAYQQLQHHRQAKDDLIYSQLHERRSYERRMELLDQFRQERSLQLDYDIREYKTKYQNLEV